MEKTNSIRIALTGPESSGKTTLARLLSEEFNCPWVSEYAREYLTERNGIYSQGDLVLMSQAQRELWDKFEPEKLVIYDTEMLVFQVWSEVKYHNCPEEIRKHVLEQKIDLYFVCRPDIPWEPDPLRENPMDREELFNLYIHYLSQLKKAYVILEGDLNNRLEKAREAMLSLKS